MISDLYEEAFRYSTPPSSLVRGRHIESCINRSYFTDNILRFDLTLNNMTCELLNLFHFVDERHSTVVPNKYIITTTDVRSLIDPRVLCQKIISILTKISLRINSSPFPCL
jgi:hypothetical protein